MNQLLIQSSDWVGRMASQWLSPWSDRHMQKLQGQLIAAGEPGNLTGRQLFGIQVVTMLVFPVFWPLVLTQLGLFDFLVTGPKQILVYVALMACGFMFPAANIRERIKKRHRSVALQLPDTVDLLTVTVDAGLDFLSALRRVVQTHRPGPLKDELE